MVMGRPPGRTAAATQGPPILHEGPGRSDEQRPGYCDSCKVPGEAAPLRTFRLWDVQFAKWAGAWTLCGKCWEWRNTPTRTATDPLHVEEENAA